MYDVRSASACEDHTTPIWVWQTLAGYQTATDVGPHAKIDLDMEELEIKVGAAQRKLGHRGHVHLRERRQRLVFAGRRRRGDGRRNDALVHGYDGGPRQLPEVHRHPHAQGLADEGPSSDKLTGADGGNYGEQMPPIYAGYWNDWAWADTFITKDYSAIAKPSGWNQLMKKGANYQAVWMYVLHELEDAIGDCYDGDIYANGRTGGAPHAWGRGPGVLRRVDGRGDGARRRHDDLGWHADLGA